MGGLRESFRAVGAQMGAGFNSLRGSPRELYLMYAVKVLESYNYFSLSRSLTLYLTEEFGVGDYRAGFYYGLWGTLLTLYGFLLGSAVDLLGVKWSLVVCFVLNIGSRLVMAATSSPLVLLVMLLGPNAVAGALGVPVMTIGIKRYTHEGNRGFAFSLFYSFMNVAALAQGVVMDALRLGLPRGFDLPALPAGSLLNSGMRLFLASGCLTSALGLALSFMLSEGARPAPAPPKRTTSDAFDSSMHSQHSAASAELELPASPEEPLLGAASAASKAGAGTGAGPRHRSHGSPSAGEEIQAAGSSAGGSGSARGVPSPRPAGAAGSGRLADLWAGGRIVLASRGFYKYLCMCLITVNLKAVFRHLDATLPKFQLRAYGCSTPIGLIYSINPAMIVLLVPVVGALLTHVQPFDAIHWGAYVSALSPFWMVAFNAEWASAAFVAMLSLGEAIWSPRWYDYSMSVAPDGREGIFTALASAPLFAAMLPTGMLSGALLQRFCPDNGQCVQAAADGARRRLLALLPGAGRWARGLAAAAVSAAAAAGGGEAPSPAPGADPAPCDGRSLWAIVGAITLTSPLLILATQRWIRPDPADFHRLEVAAAAGTTHRSSTLGETFDVNEADPLGLLENVFESSALHDAERGGGSAGAERRTHGGDAALAGGSRPGSRGSRPGSAHAQ